MIKVDLTVLDHHYCGAKITGHAYAGEPGKDLVCAAVSTLAQTLVNAVESIGGIPEASLFLKIASGHLEFKLKNDDLSDDIDIIFRTFRVGIEGIESTYPKYVKLKIKEVQGDVKNF
jgi:uncharacterized protein YsxB (DUF464 family)